ncbi:MAG: signal peptide peptidase SppA [Bacteroidetes bacterium]|nr:signal peptide peptidase SppA [Bacteroidota bacterium]MBL0066470.1 signal peptide peptidase SppA [Bacteroidota bacterium]MBL0138877.1 signal peptide peptidase SppA [Bacteroidota bacterium]
MKEFFKFMFASMLGFFLSIMVIFVISLFLIAGILSAVKSDTEISIDDNSILEITLNYPIRERSANNPFEGFSFGNLIPERDMGLDDVLKNIRKAKNDPKIKGIFLNLSGVQTGLATVEEIRNVLLEFKESKKFIYAYGEELSQGAYYIASVADRIYLNPQGSVDFKGLHAELMFFKGALEKLEIEPQIIRHGKFKSAVEPFLLDKMSPENREQIDALMTSIWSDVLTNLAVARKMSTDQLQEIADQFSSRSAKGALAAGMIDKIAYYDEVLSDLKKASGRGEKEKERFITLRKYNKAFVKSDKEWSNQKIAVIYAAGDIVSGKGQEDEIGSERLADAIRKAREDSSIKAIVLRVNSPGGSALASDVIWRETVLAKKVKPFIVSMGDYAASGGYYISCAADTIVAESNTITGSIGVFGLMFNAQKLFNNKLGITFDTIKTARFADIGSGTRAMRDDERSIIQDQVENIYDDFITHVSEGRKISKAQVDSIGQGRVWSGTDAKRLGLVDVIGGIETAINIAAKKAHLDNYRTIALPEQKEFLDKLLEDMNTEVRSGIVKEELGDSYRYYNNLKDLVRQNGIMARMQVGLEIE